MPEEKPSRPVSRRRRVFRFVRRLGLLLLLTVVVAAVYLNQIGLPGFLKDQLLASLRERGVQAEFKRLHWQWPQSVVAEGLLLRRTGDRPGPEFSSASAGVRFDWSGWFPPRGRVESMVIHNGAFSWVLTGTNQTPPLRIDSINAELAVSVDETLDLRYFSSRFHQLNLSVGGVLANPRALGHPDARPRPPANLERLNQTMTQVANYLTNLSFTAEPELKLRFTADATDWESLRADLDISAPETRTTWGSARDFRLLAKVHPPSSTNPSPAGVILLSGSSVDTPWGRLENWQAETLTVPVVQLPLNSSNEVRVGFARLQTRWGAVEDGRCKLVLRAPDTNRPAELDIELDLTGRQFVAPQGAASALVLRSEATIDRTNGRALHGAHHLEVSEIQSTNFSAARVTVRISQPAVPPEKVMEADETWGFWRTLEPLAFDFQVDGSQMTALGVQLESLDLAGGWAAPTLRLDQATASLYGGTVKLSAAIDVPRREIQAAAISDFNFHAVDHVLTERFQEWFSPYQWQGTPPHAEVSGKINWPDWRNLKPEWREEVAPTIGISGRFEVKNPSYRGVPCDEAFSDFHFTNSVWNLPNLTIVRPEGRTVATYDGDERTRDYVWRITSDLNPHALKPFFEEDQLRAFDSFTNHAPPHIEGIIYGRWRSPERIGFTAAVTAPRLEVRGEQTDRVAATVGYTNRLLTVRDLIVERSHQVGRADSLTFDFPGRVMYFSNVVSSLPPQVAARAIGPVTARAVAPYQFDQDPHVVVNGSLGLEGHDPTDLHFDITGGPFHWWRFNPDEITGHLHWRSNLLTLTNVAAKFYGGSATGGGEFEFFPGTRPTEFRFNAVVTNAQLHPLVRDVFHQTNRLEGMTAGNLTVTAGRDDSLDTWQGFGDLHLRDGLLWDIPIFALFSPVFNAISPGLGQSRADEAVASYTIVNGTIISRDLQVRSPQLTMDYQGSVDFMSNLDARMQARILKDSGAFGPLISAVLWPLTKMFEYRLTGTLGEPVAEPVHIPKFLLLALEPFKALQGILRNVGHAVTLPPTPAEPPKP